MYPLPVNEHKCDGQLMIPVVTTSLSGVIITPHNQESAAAELNAGFETSAKEYGVPPDKAFSASLAASAHFCINKFARARKP